MRLEGWHILIVIGLAILLFGAPKLPGLARSVGQSLRIFKSEVRELRKDTDVSDEVSGDPVVSPAPVPARQEPAVPSASRNEPSPSAHVQPSRT